MQPYVAISALLFMLSLSLVEEADSQEKDFVVERTSEIFRDPGGYFRVKTDLGELPAGKKVKILLTAKSNFDQDLFIGKQYYGCKCTSVTLSSDTVKAGEEVVIDVDLNVPQFLPTITQRFGMVIGKGTPTEGLRPDFTYSVSNYVGFKDHEMHFSRPQSDEDFKIYIPLVTSQDVDFDNLQLECSGQLSSAKAQIVLRDGTAFVQCVLPRTEANKISMVGEVQITNASTNHRSSVLCTVVERPPIEVVPAKIRLKWNAEAMRYTGSAILKINDDQFLELEDKSGRKPSLSAINFSAAFDGANVTLTQKVLSERVVRFEVNLRPVHSNQDFVAQSGGNTLLWIASSGKSNLTCKVGVALEN